MIIRKVSIGQEIKSHGMHYIVNQPVVDGTYTIHLIKKEENGNIRIWIHKEDIIVLWKEFNSSMPMSIEYNINI